MGLQRIVSSAAALALAVFAQFALSGDSRADTRFCDALKAQHQEEKLVTDCFACQEAGNQFVIDGMRTRCMAMPKSQEEQKKSETGLREKLAKLLLDDPRREREAEARRREEARPKHVVIHGACETRYGTTCAFDLGGCRAEIRHWSGAEADEGVNPENCAGMKRAYAATCTSYIEKGIKTDCPSPQTLKAMIDEPRNPMKEALEKYCRLHLEMIGSTALRSGSDEEKTVKAKCAYEAAQHECKAFVADFAHKKEIRLPDDGKYLDFAENVAKSELADDWKVKDAASRRCNRDVRDFGTAWADLAAEAKFEEDTGTKSADSPYRATLRSQHWALGGSIRSAVGCLEECRKDARCRVACENHGDCKRDLENLVKELAAAKPVDQACPVSAAKKEAAPEKERESAKEPERQSQSRTDDDTAKTQSQCASGFSLMTRLGFEWCGAYDLSDSDCQKAGSANVREKASAALGQYKNASPGGWRSLCLAPPLPAAAAPGDSERRVPGTAIPSLPELGIPPLDRVRQQVRNVPYDPRALAACRQFQANRDKCKREWDFYQGEGRLGQDAAPRFRECYELNRDAVNECFKRVGFLPPPSPQPAKATSPAPAQPASAAPKNTSGQSRPPDKSAPPKAAAQPEMSAQCQKLVGDYVAAAQAKDGARALAGYNALKRAGGCGVLQRVDRAPPVAKKKPAPAEDPRFVARGATPLTDSVVGACDASPAECEARVRQLRAGTSDEAKAALTMHAIGVGLELGTMIGNGMVGAMPGARNIGVPTRNTDMRSLAGPIIRSRPAQGAPAGVPQGNIRNDITGTK